MKNTKTLKIATKEDKRLFYTSMIEKCREMLPGAAYKQPYENRISIYEEELRELE